MPANSDAAPQQRGTLRSSPRRLLSATIRFSPTEQRVALPTMLPTSSLLRRQFRLGLGEAPRELFRHTAEVRRLFLPLRQLSAANLWDSVGLICSPAAVPKLFLPHRQYRARESMGKAE